MYREKNYAASNGLAALLILITVTTALLALAIREFDRNNDPVGVIAIVGVVVTSVMLGGLFIVQPNEAKALVLFGTYKGTVKQDGFWWANPFLKKEAISLRTRNFETAKL